MTGHPLKINLGCGPRYREGWTNIDFVANPPHVIGHDLRTGLPVADDVADVVYSSHVLEHFERPQAARLLAESFRVLRPAGIIRVVVPDLELLVRHYLACLEHLRRCERQGSLSHDYVWSVLALIDQLKRNSSGGEMVGFLAAREATDLAGVFLFEGEEIRALHARLHEKRTAPAHSDADRRGRRRMVRRIISLVKRLLRKVAVPPQDRQALEVGRFRLSGEVHYWMYDEASLRAALLAARFVDIRRFSAFESYTEGWRDEHLDAQPDGSVYKPSSLFMEARKPR